MAHVCIRRMHKHTIIVDCCVCRLFESYDAHGGARGAKSLWSGRLSKAIIPWVKYII